MGRGRKVSRLVKMFCLDLNCGYMDIYSCIKAKMTILVRLNTEAPMGSTLQSLSSRCRSQSCDLAPVWMDGVAWTCGSENSGR